MPRRRGEEGGGEGGSATLRAFLAVELSPAARRAVAELLVELRAAPGADRVRWVRPENLHVTLRFLGDVPRDRVPALAEGVRCEVAGLPPFALRLGAPGWLSGRVFFLELLPAAPLVALAEAVERGVVAAGAEPEARPFRPHLTLGRLRRGGRPGVTSAVTAESDPFAVEEVVLFESRLLPGGAHYTARERMALGGSRSSPL